MTMVSGDLAVVVATARGGTTPNPNRNHRARVRGVETTRRDDDDDDDARECGDDDDDDEEEEEIERGEDVRGCVARDAVRRRRYRGDERGRDERVDARTRRGDEDARKGEEEGEDDEEEDEFVEEE